MRLADEKGMLVPDLQRRVTSGQFVDWLTYYEMKAEEELKAHTKEDHYAAMIAWQVRQILEALCEVPRSKRSQLKDLLLSFDGSVDPVKPKKPLVNPYRVKLGEVPGIEIGKTKLTPEQQLACDNAKLAWIMAFGPSQR